MKIGRFSRPEFCVLHFEPHRRSLRLGHRRSGGIEKPRFRRTFARKLHFKRNFGITAADLRCKLPTAYVQFGTVRNNNAAENAVQSPVVVGIELRAFRMSVRAHRENVLAFAADKRGNIEFVGVERAGEIGGFASVHPNFRAEHDALETQTDAPAFRP